MVEGADRELVSSCGIYCGQCHRYKKGKCPGCVALETAKWCKVRSCTRERGIYTCAECAEYEDVQECPRFNTFMAKIFAFIFKSDRKASLVRISEIGVEKYAREMDELQIPVLKRK